MNGLDRCLVSFVPASFIGSSGGGRAQVVHRSAVEQVVTFTAGVTVSLIENLWDILGQWVHDSYHFPGATYPELE